VRGVRGDDIEPPSQIKKNLVNKNTMKPKMVFHLRFCPKSIDFGKNLRNHSQGFSTLCIYGSCVKVPVILAVMYDENT
jgi:hypothetical protein